MHCIFNNSPVFVLVRHTVWALPMSQTSNTDKTHQEMRYPNMTWRIISYGYLFTTELRHTGTPEYFWSNSYISNGRRFTKTALRILLLSIFRTSTINYFGICSLLIHTRSSANAEVPGAHCQLKSCKMLHKCSTDCIWKGLQPVNNLQGHSRSLPLLPFDRPYTISYYSSIVSVAYLYFAPFSRY